MTLQLTRFRKPLAAAGWPLFGTALLAAAAAVCIGGAGRLELHVQYLVVVALIVGWMMVAGVAFNRHPAGLLIDGRNVISLSRLQLFVWLVIVGCAFAVEVAYNFHLGALTNYDRSKTLPDSVKLPLQLGLVMGAATTSFVASPALLSLKSRRRPSQEEWRRAFARSGGKARANTGLLFARRPAEQALWVDLLRGDELGTADSADPAKVQQFLATFLLATIYLASLWGQLVPPTAGHLFETLPDISGGGLVLLGVSHAAYLGAKAVPQTPGDPNTATIPHVDTAPQVLAQVPPPPLDPPVTI